MGRPGPTSTPVSARFFSKVAQRGECLEWIGAVNNNGYGLVHAGIPLSSRKIYAHRWSYEYHIGPIPDGHQIDHLCRNRRCVNPSHLEAVLPAVNILRGVSGPAKNARKTTCKRGHGLSGKNVYVSPSTGYRSCRECRRLRLQAIAKSRKAA